MATTYHSIINTVKMHGKKYAWEYLGKFLLKV